MYTRLFKRILDIFVVILAGLFIWPVFVLVGLLVRIKLGSPVLFVQERPGKDGKIFKMRKFRSMTDERGEDGELLPDVDRLPAFGRFLRSSSLDELPELWNVLRGEMSLVGPRPLLVEYLPLYNEEQGRRHEVKPGITGWAQVNGRNAVTWEERFEMDVWYVENCSFILDLKIIFMTFWTVIKKENVQHSKNETFPKFTGTSR